MSEERESGTEQEHAALLTTLRALASRIDPLPPRVDDAARDALTWRSVDAELADVAFESLLEERPLEGVRGLAQAQLLTFECPRMAIDLEVTAGSADRRSIVGQIVPPKRMIIQICTVEGTNDVHTDDLGRFTAEEVAAGPVSLRCHPDPGEPPVHTRWMNL